jgi:nucleolar protein 12
LKQQPKALQERSTTHHASNDLEEMGLVDSIFGRSSDATSEKTAPQKSVFDETVHVPEPTPLPPPDSRRSKKRKVDEVKEAAKQETRVGPPKKQGPSKEDAEQRTIFVGNLPVDTTPKRLRELFKECGAIESTRIRSVAITGVKLPPQRAGDQGLVKKVCVHQNKIDPTAKPSVVGYVVFKDESSVHAAMQLNNMVEGTKKLRVDTAKPTVDPARSVFVGNLPYQAEEEALRLHFETNCDLEPQQILGVRIIRDPETYQCRGFGYILFEDKTHVTTALQRMNETKFMKRDIRVMVCGKRFKGKRGEEVPDKDKKKKEPTSIGALKRILTKAATEDLNTNKRVRGDKKKTKGPAASTGKSRRAFSEAKADKRVKKIEKRIKKGMGKARK